MKHKGQIFDGESPDDCLHKAVLYLCELDSSQSYWENLSDILTVKRRWLRKNGDAWVLDGVCRLHVLPENKFYYGYSWEECLHEAGLPIDYEERMQQRDGMKWSLSLGFGWEDEWSRIRMQIMSTPDSMEGFAEGLLKKSYEGGTMKECIYLATRDITLRSDRMDYFEHEEEIAQCDVKWFTDYGNGWVSYDAPRYRMHLLSNNQYYYGDSVELCCHEAAREMGSGRQYWANFYDIKFSEVEWSVDAGDGWEPKLEKWRMYLPESSKYYHGKSKRRCINVAALARSKKDRSDFHEQLIQIEQEVKEWFVREGNEWRTME